MAGFCRSAILLQPHSYALFGHALDEGVVNVYVNEHIVKARVSGTTPEAAWQETVSALLLHDRVLLTEENLNPDITFPDGKLHLTFDPKRKDQAFLKALTNPPRTPKFISGQAGVSNTEEWLFTKVLTSADALAKLTTTEYLTTGIFADFFRYKALVARAVGSTLIQLGDLIGTLMKLGHSPFVGYEPEQLAVEIATYGLTMSLRSLGADGIAERLRKAGLIEAAGAALNLRGRVGQDAFNCILSFFTLAAMKHVPFYRTIVEEAGSNDCCILGDTALAASLNGIVPVTDRGAESTIIGIFRLMLGHGDIIRPPTMTLKEALSVRQEPWVTGFRRSVARAVEVVASGKSDASQAAIDEFYSAQNRFLRALGIAKVGAMVTYLAAPLSLVEPLLGTTIGGISFSFVSAVATWLFSRELKRGVEWVVRLP